MNIISRAGGILVLIGVLIILIGTSSNFRDAESNTVKLQLIEAIKNDCTVVRKNIVSNTITYLCDDGIEYTISEELQ